MQIKERPQTRETRPPTITGSRATDAKIGISADRRFFTLNGVPTFLYGISSTVYHWVITVENGRTEVWRNNQKLFSEDCSRAFAPDNRILVFIGGNAYGKLSTKNITYSNVKIYQL